MHSLFHLNGRDIWVIGGAGYLGTASIRVLVEAGARVLCVDLGQRAQEMVSREKLEDRVTPVTWEVSEGESTRRFLGEWLERRGVPDGLVMMTYKSFPKAMSALTAEEFDLANRVNITATFICAREAGQAMAEKGRGSIVIFSSMYGTVSPDPGMYPSPLEPNPIEYGVAKAGLQQLARYLAVRWARRNVRCNSISPGPFPFPSQQETNPDWIDRIRNRCPMGRVGLPHEMAGAVLYLLSDASSYVTGHNLAVDGGWTAW